MAYVSLESSTPVVVHVRLAIIPLEGGALLAAVSEALEAWASSKNLLPQEKAIVERIIPTVGACVDGWGAQMVALSATQYDCSRWFTGRADSLTTGSYACEELAAAGVTVNFAPRHIGPLPHREVWRLDYGVLGELIQPFG